MGTASRRRAPRRHDTSQPAETPRRRYQRRRDRHGVGLDPLDALPELVARRTGRGPVAGLGGRRSGEQRKQPQLIVDPSPRANIRRRGCRADRARRRVAPSGAPLCCDLVVSVLVRSAFFLRPNNVRRTLGPRCGSGIGARSEAAAQEDPTASARARPLAGRVHRARQQRIAVGDRGDRGDAGHSRR